MKQIQIDLPPERPNRDSWWTPVALRTKASPDELVGMLRRQSRRYRGADFFDCIEAIMAGALRHVDVQALNPIKNKINEQLLDDTWGARLVNAHTAANDGILRYMAVGTNNSDPSESLPNLPNEFFRDVPLTKKHAGSQQKFILHLDFDDANLEIDTTVKAGTWSKTVFEVTDPTGFHVGAAVRVAGSLTSFSRITAIAGDQITLDPAQPLSAVPVEDDAVNLCIGGTASYGGTDATTDLQSGHPYAISKLRIYKNADLAYFIKQTFLRTAL